MIKNFFHSTMGAILFVALLIVTLSIGYVMIMKRLYKEEPHPVTIGGKQYMRWTEFNGKHYQIMMVPIDSTAK